MNCCNHVSMFTKKNHTYQNQHWCQKSDGCSSEPGFSGHQTVLWFAQGCQKSHQQVCLGLWQCSCHPWSSEWTVCCLGWAEFNISINRLYKIKCLKQLDGILHFQEIPWWPYLCCRIGGSAAWSPWHEHSNFPAAAFFSKDLDRIIG